MNTAKLSRTSPGESTREHYRRQGEQRFAELLITELNQLLEHRPQANWSPRYLIGIIEALSDPTEITERSRQRLSV